MTAETIHNTGSTTALGTFVVFSPAWISVSLASICKHPQASANLDFHVTTIRDDSTTFNLKCSVFLSAPTTLRSFWRPFVLHAASAAKGSLHSNLCFFHARRWHSLLQNLAFLHRPHCNSLWLAVSILLQHRHRDPIVVFSLNSSSKLSTDWTFLWISARISFLQRSFWHVKYPPMISPTTYGSSSFQLLLGICTNSVPGRCPHLTHNNCDLDSTPNFVVRKSHSS